MTTGERLAPALEALAIATENRNAACAALAELKANVSRETDAIKARLQDLLSAIVLGEGICCLAVERYETAAAAVDVLTPPVTLVVQ